MYSLKVFLVSILMVSIGAAPMDIETTTEAELEIDLGEPLESFDAEKYKEYLLNLKCMGVVINHGGNKYPEVESGTIYKPTTTTSTTTERSLDKHLEESPGRNPEYDDGSEDKKLLDKSYYHEETKGTKVRRSTGPENSTSVPTVPFVENSTIIEVNNTEVCTAPLTDNWAIYDWYQILVDNGGAPGKLNVTGAKPNLTRAENPCARPLEFESPQHDKVWYITKSLQHDKRVYREEKVSLRFPDTPHEFLDVKGLLVWSPPGEKYRSYHISYRKDDTGLYVSLDREHRCRFTDPIHTLGIECEDTGSLECTCENGHEVCVDLNEAPISLSPGLLASLAGK